MSSSKKPKRPPSQYKNALYHLLNRPNANPRFAKLLDKLENDKPLSRFEKSAIARAAKLPPIKKRYTDKEFIDKAIELAPIIPSVRKYVKRKKLRPAERAAISHKINLSRYQDHWVKISDSAAKNLPKENLVAPGIHAVQLKGMGERANVERIDKEGNLFVESFGRRWIFWRLENVKPPKVEKAGKTVFDENQFNAKFDIEKIKDLAEKAFTSKTLQVAEVKLWAEVGPVGPPLPSLRQFIHWIYESYSTYKHVDRWVNGIAIMLKDNGKPAKKKGKN